MRAGIPSEIVMVGGPRDGERVPYRGPSFRLALFRAPKIDWSAGDDTFDANEAATSYVEFVLRFDPDKPPRYVLSTIAEGRAA